MSVYGFDEGHNMSEVASQDAIDNLQEQIDEKQANLTATDGAVQSDCNTLVNTGYYYITSLTANGPGVDGCINVIRLNESGSIIFQEVTNTEGSIKCIRVFSNGSWTDWHQNYYNMDVIIDQINANIEQNAENISELQNIIPLKQNATDENLFTDEKEIVPAINELYSKESLLETEVNNKQNSHDLALQTTQKDVVPAINELYSEKQAITDNTLSTTAKTVPGAINEHEGDILDIANNKIPVWLREDAASTMIQAPGDLTQFGAWLKTQTTANRLFWGKVNPTNSGYFGTSSFYFQANCSSTNYGVALLLCDNGNKASMVTGQLIGGTWHWYAHQGTAI